MFFVVLVVLGAWLFRKYVIWAQDNNDGELPYSGLGFAGQISDFRLFLGAGHLPTGLPWPARGSVSRFLSGYKK